MPAWSALRALFTMQHDRVGVAAEIGGEDLDEQPGDRGELPDRLGEVRGAPVREIVAVDRRHHHVLQTHRLDRLGEPPRLLRIEGIRRPVRHRAVGAVPGADVAEDQEGGGPVVPAVPDVGAVRFLAHRVQLEVPHQMPDLRVGLTPRRLHLEPRRLADGDLGEGTAGPPAGGDLDERKRLVLHWQDAR